MQLALGAENYLALASHAHLECSSVAGKHALMMIHPVFPKPGTERILLLVLFRNIFSSRTLHKYGASVVGELVSLNWR